MFLLFLLTLLNNIKWRKPEVESEPECCAYIRALKETRNDDFFAKK